MSFTEYNQYLFYEFGIDLESDESGISDSWPFTFTLIQESQILGIPTRIHELKSEESSPHPELSAWKRLAIGIGKLVIDKKT